MKHAQENAVRLPSPDISQQRSILSATCSIAHFVAAVVGSVFDRVLNEESQASQFCGSIIAFWGIHDALKDSVKVINDLTASTSSSGSMFALSVCILDLQNASFTS